MTSYDLCVVGGGPAGSVFATLARRRGQRVVLFHVEPNGKPGCETLSAEAACLLHETGLTWCLETSGAIRSSGTISAWDAPRRTTFDAILDPGGPRWHVDRGEFDAALRRAARIVGVEIVHGRVDAVHPTAEGFRIGAGDFFVASRTLVDGTGAVARVARLLRQRRVVLDRQVAVYACLERSSSEPALELASFAEGWLYTTPRASRTTQLTVVTDAEVLQTYGHHELVRRALRILNLDATSGDLIDVRTWPITTHFVKGVHTRSFACLGDASWTADPLSGHGVARAIQDAVRLSSSPALEASPSASVLEHLRMRQRQYAATPWSAEPYYQNRLRALRIAEGWSDEATANASA